VLLATVNVKAVENDTIRISYVWDFSELDENGDSIWYFGKDIGQEKTDSFYFNTKGVQIDKTEHGDTCLMFLNQVKYCSITGGKLCFVSKSHDVGLIFYLYPGWTCKTFFHTNGVRDKKLLLRRTITRDDGIWEPHLELTLTTLPRASEIEFNNSYECREKVYLRKLVISNQSNNTDYIVYCLYVKLISPAMLPITTKSVYSTYCSNYNLDFTWAKGIEAYKAAVADEEGEKVLQLTRVYKVQAGTGIIIKTPEGGVTANVPVIPDSITPTYDNSGNELVGVNEDKEISYSSANDGKCNYVMSVSDSTMVKAPETAAYLRANKAYLSTKYNIEESEAKAMRIVIVGNDSESESSGINETSARTIPANNRIYTLSGIATTKPSKGIYIKNGKKIIIN